MRLYGCCRGHLIEVHGNSVWFAVPCSSWTHVEGCTEMISASNDPQILAAYRLGGYEAAKELAEKRAAGG